MDYKHKKEQYEHRIKELQAVLKQLEDQKQAILIEINKTLGKLDLLSELEAAKPLPNSLPTNTNDSNLLNKK